MAALVVLEGEAAAVLPPDGRCEVVGVGEEGVIDLDLLLAGDVEQRGIGDIERVAGLAIDGSVDVLRLHLVGGRRFDVVHLAVVAGARVIGRQLFGIGRPGDRAERVVVAFRAVEAQRSGGLARAGGPQEDVEVLDERFPFAVERGADLGFGHRLADGAAPRPPRPSAGLRLAPGRAERSRADRVRAPVRRRPAGERAARIRGRPSDRRHLARAARLRHRKVFGAASAAAGKRRESRRPWCRCNR